MSEDLAAWAQSRPQSVPAVQSPADGRMTPIELKVVREDVERIEAYTAEVADHLAAHLLEHTLRDADELPKAHLFPQAREIVGQWLESGRLVTRDGTVEAQLAYRQIADEVCSLIAGAINVTATGRLVRAMLDPYNPEGSTAAVNFTTSKTDCSSGDSPMMFWN